MYLVLSPDLVILTASNAYLEASMTKRDNIVGRPLFEVFPDRPGEDGVLLTNASLRQALAARQPHQMDTIRYDLVHPTQPGQRVERYWSIAHTPVMDETGTVQYVIHRADDVTEQIRTEARLKVLQEQQKQARDRAEGQLSLLQDLLDQAPVGVCLYQGYEPVVAMANQLMCNMLGYPAEQIVGFPLLEAVPELQGQGFDQLIQKVIKTGIPYRGIETPAQLLRDGQVKTTYYNFVYQPLRNEREEVIGVVTVAVDVTDHVEARQKTEQSQQKVQALNEELAAINEELRTTNKELTEAKATLEQLNSELEERVAARTQEVRQAQTETQRQKDRLERFFMQAPAIVNIQLGPEHVFELVHPLTYQLLGNRPLVGKSMRQSLPELEGPFPELLDQVYRTGEPFYGKEVQVRLNRRGNQEPVEAYFNFTYQPILDATGQVEGVMTFAVDVTDQVLARQRAEQMAQKVEEQAQAFDRTLTALQDFVYTFDTQSRFAYANRRLLDLLGVSLNELVGKSFHELPYPQELADTLQAHVAQVVSTGQPLTDETPYTNPKGHLGYYEYIFKPIFDQHRQVILVAGSTRDITERKRSEEALRLKNEELIRINTDLDNFIYTASHDLKAPISNIESLLTALLRTLSAESRADPRAQRITAMMQASVERFKRTIANLTEIVKLQKENSGAVVSVNLSEVVREVRLDLESMIRSSGVELIVKVDDKLSVQFSEKNLRSVVYNLLSNAIKYCSPDRVPHVLIESESQPEYHVLTVQDNGLGMETGRLDQLFTMFKRFHDHVEGTGIGLYMVKKMVENAAGKIEVDSQLNKGSTFRVYFKR